MSDLFVVVEGEREDEGSLMMRPSSVVTGLLPGHEEYVY